MGKAVKPRIVIIGSGHLAWHLAAFFVSRGIHPDIFNHQDSKTLQAFKKRLKCRINPSLTMIPHDSEYYFICVSDRYIKSVSRKLNKVSSSALFLHCSGTLPLDEIKAEDKQRAVFYPLQSFTASDHLDWKEIPILLEARHPLAKSKLKKLAGLFPGKKLFPDQHHRLLIHLCAVLVNNFSNLLYTEAHKLLEKNGQGSMFKHLFPLIRKAAEKLEEMNPVEAQTGPARRGDRVVMNKHRALISRDKDLLKLYNLLSKRIQVHQTTANA